METIKRWLRYLNPFSKLTKPKDSPAEGFFKKLRIIGFSKKKNVLGMNPLFMSIAFIILTEIIASLLRKLVKRFVGNRALTQQLFLEFVATAELCAVCYELIIVADNFGVVMYAVFLFLLTLWWTKVWTTETACPYLVVEEYWEGREILQRMLMIIAAQVLGGFVIFFYIQQLWQLELVQTHRGRAFAECSADLHVNMLFGAMIECVGTLLCRLTYKVLAETEGKFAGLFNAFFATSMVVAAFDYSGGYFNPALASSLKFNCRGNTTSEHILAYWIGATVGALLSIYIFNTKMMQDLASRLRNKFDVPPPSSIPPKEE